VSGRLFPAMEAISSYGLTIYTYIN